MGLFGSLFGFRQQSAPQSAPQADASQRSPKSIDDNVNPYAAVYHHWDNPLIRFAGGFAGENVPLIRARALDAAQQWDERHRTANMIYDPSQDNGEQSGYGQSPAYQQPAPRLPQMTRAPDGGGSPGPMDSIAAYAQGYDPQTDNGGLTFTDATARADGSVTPIRGGTRIAVAPVPQQMQGPGMPSFGDLFPKMAQQQDAHRMERLRAQIARQEALGIDTTGLRQAYNLVDPAYGQDAVPQYWSDVNGARHRTANGQDKVVADVPIYTQTPNAIVRTAEGKSAPVISWGTPDRYTDAYGNPHTSVYNPFPSAEYGQGGSGAPSGGGQSSPPMVGQAQQAGAGGGSGQYIPLAAPPTFGPNDTVQALQVALAEDPKNPVGILSTIINRAAAKGTSIGEVLREPGQFEVVSNGRAAKVPQASAMALLNDPAVAGMIQGGAVPSQYAGVTQFYSPGAQKALGRKAPAWDDGSGFDVGQTRFFRTPEGMGTIGARGATASAGAPARPPMKGDPRFTDIPMAGSMDMNAPGGGDLSALTGDDLIKALPPAVGNQVRMLAEGKLPIPTGNKAASPMWQRLFQLASQYDQSFDAVNYPSRVATQKSFSAGQDARNVTSINTTIAHLGKLYDTVGGLGNGGMTPLNLMVNGPHAAMDPNYAARVRSFKLAKTAVIDEMTRAFKGTGGSVHDVEQFEKSIQDSDSPQALYAAIGTGLDLLDGRLQALSDRYAMGMNRQVSPDYFLTEKSKATLNRIYGISGGTADASGPPTVPQVPGFKYLGVK